MLPPGKLNRGALARFMRKISQNPETGCWEWQGETNRNGYGLHRVNPGERPRVTHRIAYEHFRDTIPEGLQADHLCRNRICCNPDHMEIVTNAVNTDRQDHANRRKTHCPKGHEYTEANTRIDVNGKRYCRACRKSV